MSKIVFRNHDKAAIRELLKEIGRERYEHALRDNGIEQKPLGMHGFFLEFDTATGNVDLYHRYPSTVELHIMSVLGFWRVPERHWEMYRP